MLLVHCNLNGYKNVHCLYKNRPWIYNYYDLFLNIYNYCQVLKVLSFKVLKLRSGHRDVSILFQFLNKGKHFIYEYMYVYDCTFENKALSVLYPFQFNCFPMYKTCQIMIELKSLVIEISRWRSSPKIFKSEWISLHKWRIKRKTDAILKIKTVFSNLNI